MIPLLIANLVVSSLILCVLAAVGARLFVVTVRANAQRNVRPRPQFDPGKVAKAASLLEAAVAARAQKAAAGRDPQPGMTPTAPPVKETPA